jgi:N-acetylmuramoyl-L-alanine amidase
MEIANHRLIGVPFEETPNKGGVLEASYLIVHYTVVTSMAATVRAFKNPAIKASAHLVLDVDGSLTQMVPFNVVAWHAGKSQWAGRVGCNSFTIGIEVVNPGPLSRRANGFFDVNGRVWAGDVVEARHKNGHSPFAYWAAYTPAQIDKLKEVGSLLVTQYSLRDVVGHDDISPTRKIDPGPAFPMDSYRGSLFGRAEDEGDFYLATTSLNVRQGPAVSFAPVEGSPLRQGQRVEVVEQNDAWWHVQAVGGGVEGWVHRHYLVRT